MLQWFDHESEQRVVQLRNGQQTNVDMSDMASPQTGGDAAQVPLKLDLL
jgi:hypothetical protein